MKTNSNISSDDVSLKGKTTAGRDGDHESLWQSGLKPVQLKSQPGATAIYDILVIGGGITGLTAALILQNAGRKCVLADAHTIGFGTTGGTTAHINTFADTSYKEAESAFGEDGAKLFAEAINEAIAIIKENIKQYNIDCDFEEKPGFIYAEDEKQSKQLDEVYKSTLKVGVNISYTDEVPIPVPYQKAVQLNGQAQFHPLKYIKALQDEFEKAGGLIIEHTLIDEVTEEDKLLIAKCGERGINAHKIIYATHMPPGINMFSFTCAPYRSYVLGVTLKNNNYPDAMIYDMQDPYHYFRSHVVEGQTYLLVGGNDHKTGHNNPETAFAELENYTRKYYDVEEVKYKWSAQYYIPADGFPYIGHFTGNADGVYCATGYNGNGMMLGTIAAKILSDLAMGNKSKYENIFSTSRIKPVDSFSEFVKENADVAYHFIADRLTVQEKDSLKQIPNGTGKVIKFDGKKVAAYRDDDGNLHALNPVCTHAKCIVNWNAEEKSWDCPCHGARYDVNGHVLTGPAQHDLEQLNTSDN